MSTSNNISLGSLLGQAALNNTATYTHHQQQLAYPAGVLATATTTPHPLIGVVTNFVGMARIRKVENGYVIEVMTEQWGQPREFFAEDLKVAGERLTAECVAKELKGQNPASSA